MPHLISVIIPVHNGVTTLAQAVASVREQGFADLELIVVDDGSTDGVSNLLAALGPDVVCLRQPQRGVAAARNRGLAAARGDFIAFLDADDLWPPDKLRLQTNCLLADETLDVVSGHIQPIDETGVALGAPVVGAQLGCAVFRRSVFAKVGLFDARLMFSEDHDWFLRAREQNARLLALQEVTLLYRRHPASMTHGAERRDYGLPEILKASLDRRRAAEQRARSLPKFADLVARSEPTAIGISAKFAPEKDYATIKETNRNADDRTGAQHLLVFQPAFGTQ